jgi:hypothetical protein
MARSHILYRQAAEQTGISDEEFWAAQAPILETAAESGRYPNVFALPEDTFDIEPERSMLFGLRRLLDGLETFIEARAGGENAPDAVTRGDAGACGAGP